MSLPQDWQADFSRVLDIRTDDGARVDFDVSRENIVINGFVKPGDKIVITYTLPHVLTETQDTIPFVDREAVANWAAAFCWTAWPRDMRGQSPRQFLRTVSNMAQRRTITMRRPRRAASFTAITWDWTTNETPRREQRWSLNV